MAFELLITFVDPDLVDRVRVKARVIEWLEANGRTDFVDGVIDGLETPISDDEATSGDVRADRFDSAPLALFDDQKMVCDELLALIYIEFGESLRGKVTEISDDSWSQCWRVKFEPIETQRFVIAPLGSSVETPDDKLRIELTDGGLAFGTGQHATTRAVIRLIESRIEEWRPTSLLDVGTGTGIYLIVASRLGVRRLTGTEISSDLAAIAMDNCEVAGVVAEIKVCEKPVFNQSFDLVIANILAPVLVELLPQFEACLAPAGRLVLAGFVSKEEEFIMRAARSQKLKLVESSSELGWKCLVFERENLAAFY